MTGWSRAEFLRGVAALFAAASPLRAAPRQGLRLVQWSDIHWGSRQDDAAAWREALRLGLQSRPQIAVLTGDQIDNSPQGRSDFARSMVDFWRVSGPLIPANLPLALCLGNADFRNNYQTDEVTLRETYRLQRRELGSRYYLDELGNGKLEALGTSWLSLNSLVFSPKNHATEAETQADRSLRLLEGWLRAGLHPAVLLLHIPPVHDLFSHDLAWHSHWIERFWQVLAVGARPISILSGHFHRNEVHGHRLPGREIPLVVGGSLSRKYDYAPNWRTHYIGTGWSTRIHYCGRPQWSSRYGWGRLAELETGLRQADFFARYIRDVFAGHLQLAGEPERYRSEVMEHFWSGQESTGLRRYNPRC